MSNEELETYKQQIVLIEQKLAACQNEFERAEYSQVKADLEELVALMTESEDVIVEPTSSDFTSTVDMEWDDAWYDMLGSKCMAPYLQKTNLPISLHSAIIYEFDPPKSNADTTITVRVLYSHPLVQKMKPCHNFLDGNCMFEENCRFSHGEAIPIEELEEYKEPNFMSVKPGSTILAKIQDLWDVARVTSIDEDSKEMAIKRLVSGKEVSVKMDSVVPLDEDINDIVEESRINVPAHVISDHFSELKGSSSGRVAVSDLGNWNGGGFGLKLMQKMGYKIGGGLGKHGDGIVHAIQATMVPKKKSLDYIMENKHQVKVVDGKQATRSRLTKEMSKMRDSDEMCIFTFINRKLEEKPKQTDKERVDAEKVELRRASDKHLVEQVLNVEKEIKDLRSKERKLKDGLIRNKSDKKTAERLQLSLEQVQNQISKLEGKQGRVHREKDSRISKKKDIF